MSNLVKRLDAHFVACAAAAGAAVVSTAQQSEAAIVWSGIVNLPIRNTINGLYLNVVTGANNEPANGTGGSVPGWDINPYVNMTMYGFGNPGYAYVPSGTSVAALAAGAAIDGTTCTAVGSASGTLFPTADPGAYYGFKFQNEAMGNALQYGWARIRRLAGAETAGVLYEYAYDNTGAGIAAGAVPAPGSLALLALGAAGLAGRRRK